MLLEQEQLKSSGKRSGKRGTPDGPDNNKGPSSGYNTPVSKHGPRRQDNEEERSSIPEGILKAKEQLIEKLKRQVRAERDEKNKNSERDYMAANVLENEVALMKQKLKEQEERIACMNSQMDLHPSFEGFGRPKAFKTADKGTQSVGTSTRDSGVEIQDVVKSNRTKHKTVEDLKYLVAEYENESSELQEIIDESKDAIFELTKALQGSNEVYLVDSTYKIEPKKQIGIDETDNFRPPLDKSEYPLEKSSCVLARLSSSDTDVTTVLSKLRIAVSQLESRLGRVQTEKQHTEAKIQKIKVKKHEQKQERMMTPKSSREEVEVEVLLESRSSRSAVIDIAKKRDATIIDGTIDDIAHQENRKPRDESSFQHSSRCKLLWQQLCEARASISGHEREVSRQKIIYHKSLAECQQKAQQAQQVERNIAEAEQLAHEQCQNQEYFITDLEEKLMKEQEGSEMLLMKLENAHSQLEKAQQMNASLNEKLEETGMLLHKHHKSSEKKLDAILGFMKEDMIGHFKGIIDSELRRASPLRYSGQHNRTSSCNASFHSVDPAEVELASKRSRGRRGRGIEEHAYRTATHGYKTIDELETLKSRLGGIQDNVKTLVTSVDQVQREKSKLQDERSRLLERLHLKDEEVKKFDSRLDVERRKLQENDDEYQAEMDALKAEQLEV